MQQQPTMHLTSLKQQDTDALDALSFDTYVLHRKYCYFRGKISFPRYTFKHDVNKDLNNMDNMICLFRIWSTQIKIDSNEI